jgi:MFS superfamily sulfate permease-like transporter
MRAGGRRRIAPSSQQGWGRSLKTRVSGLKGEWLRADVVAGLTTAAVVIPKAMAYATVAGLPVQVGIYTAFAPMILYALLGSSRVLSVSTTTTLAILAGARSRVWSARATRRRRRAPTPP